MFGNSHSPGRRSIAEYLVAASALVFITPADAELENFCDRLPRPAYAAFEKHEISNDWFEVYEVAQGVWAIYEPFQWQEVISYLIEGAERDLLFDTGNGIGDIKAIVDQLSDKPVLILNSHTHFDHVGGNYQFDDIASVSTDFSIDNSKGHSHEEIATEVSDDALCKGLPQGVSAGNHVGRPFTITQKVMEGDVIDIGTRQLEVLQIPGHTPDAIALLDRKAGFMWTGDSFYEGPIWLFSPETDLEIYRKSLARLVAFVPDLTALFPAHNTPRSDPAMLLQVQKAFDQVIAGQAEPVPAWEGTVTFEFDGFGFLMREDYTRPE